MKTTRNLILIIALALLPTWGNAQTHLEKAATDFLENKDLAKFFNNNSDESGDGYYYKICNFSIPKSKSKALEDIIEAFSKDTKESYGYYEQHKGSSTGEFKVIAYGKDNHSNVYFGLNTSHNYRAMFFNGGQSNKSHNNYARFNNSLNDKKRTVYALAWYEKGTNIEGSLYLIYGDNPQKTQKSVNYKVSKVNIFSNLNELNDLANNRDLLVNDSIKTSDDFLSKFGGYRSLFKLYSNNEDIRLSTVNKILKLCKNSGSLLDVDEKRVVSNSINDLMTISKDSYQKELLGLALKYLK